MDRDQTQKIKKAKEDRKWLVQAIMQEMKYEDIVIPPCFLNNLFRNTRIAYGVPTIKAIRGVIKMCRYWEKYCADENEFSKLVCTKIYSMLKLHGAAIISNVVSGETCYIGSICKLKEGVKLPAYTCTSATFDGSTILQEGFGGPLRDL